MNEIPNLCGFTLVVLYSKHGRVEAGQFLGLWTHIFLHRAARQSAKTLSSPTHKASILYSIYCYNVTKALFKCERGKRDRVQV